MFFGFVSIPVWQTITFAEFLLEQRRRERQMKQNWKQYLNCWLRQQPWKCKCTSVNMYVCHTLRPSICMYVTLFMVVQELWFTWPTWSTWLTTYQNRPTYLGRVYKSRSSQLFKTCFSCSTLETNESDHIKLWAAVRAICNFLLDLWHSST